MLPREVLKTHPWCRAYISHEAARRKAAQPSPERVVLFQQVYDLCEFASEILAAGRDYPTAPEMKAILRMRFIEGKTINEVADELYIPSWRVRQFEQDIIGFTRLMLAKDLRRRAA